MMMMMMTIIMIITSEWNAKKKTPGKRNEMKYFCVLNKNV